MAHFVWFQAHMQLAFGIVAHSSHRPTKNGLTKSTVMARVGVPWWQFDVVHRTYGGFPMMTARHSSRSSSVGSSGIDSSSTTFASGSISPGAGLRCGHFRLSLRSSSRFHAFTVYLTFQDSAPSELLSYANRSSYPSERKIPGLRIRSVRTPPFPHRCI